MSNEFCRVTLSSPFRIEILMVDVRNILQLIVFVDISDTHRLLS